MSVTMRSQQIRHARRHMGKKASKALGDLGAYAFLAGFGILILIPIAWMCSTALKSDGDVWLFPPQWIPDPLHWENFSRAFDKAPWNTSKR